MKRLDLLQNLCKKILIPKKVREEIFIKETPETTYLKKFLFDYIIEDNSKRLRGFPLGKGEQAAISLCLEKKVMFVSDDLKARKFAESLGLFVMGTLGILLDNLQKGKITKKEALSLLHQLLNNGMYLSTEVYAEVERVIGEN